MGIKSWRDFLEAKSGRDEFSCPHPEDKDFCRQWGLYIKGEGPMPVWDGDKFRKSIGHYQGPRASSIKSDKDKKRDASGRRGSRHDWRRGG